MDQAPTIDSDLLQGLSALLHLEPSDINLRETFVQNGGDSLRAITFSKMIQRSEHIHVGAGIILKSKQIGTLLDKTQIRKLGSAVSVGPQRSTERPKLAPLQAGIDDNAVDPIQRFPKIIPTDGLPVTFIQAATAHYTHLIPGAAVQHVTQYCYTDLLPRLKTAFIRTMSIYQAFRLQFDVQLQPLLVTTSLKDSFEIDWAEREVGELEEPGQEDLCRAWAVEASRAPVFRILTPRKSMQRRKLSVVHWFCHLALMDGRSMDIVMHYVDAIMQDPTSTVDVHDRIFQVTRDLSNCRERNQGTAAAFWASHQEVEGSRNHPLLCVLDDRVTSTVRMEFLSVVYPEDVKHFQSRTGYTFEVLVRAAMALVISQLQDAAQVSLVTVSSRRSLPIPAIDEAVGSFASSMILNIDIKEHDTAECLLEQVFDKILELEEICYTDPCDGFSLGGLVVISSDLQPHAPWYSGGNQTEVMSPKETLTTLYVGSNGRVRFCYNSQWRSKSEMQVLVGLFEKAMINLGIRAQDVREIKKELLPGSQRDDILDWGNCHSENTISLGIADDIISLFEKQVEDRDSEPALELRDQHISYRDLEHKVQRVARNLQHILEPRSVVMLHADGSVQWIVAMLAVLRADCVFSPQGAKISHQIRSQHYDIAKAKAFLIPRVENSPPRPDGCQLTFCVETILSDVSALYESAVEPNLRQPTPHSDAYICFSSGTSGRPKAIRCVHSGVVSLLRDPVARLHVIPGRRVAQTMAPPFDGALQEVFSALCYGGTLVLKDPLEPFQHLTKVDSLLMTPSLAAELDPKEHHHVKNIYFGAELLPQGTADSWSAGSAIVHNVYGPTECHMIATAQRVQAGTPVTIGKPLFSARIYILDKQGRFAPPLVAGEIHIAGVQVSQGYIDLEEQTKLCFIPDTIRNGKNDRMYRTGDWGYWTLNGEIAFMGRKDRQVKLEGFRVDLNDVQARLQKALDPAVQVIAVIVRGVLGCAVSGKESITPEHVKAVAKDALSPQQVPKVIRCIDAIPVSSVGKVDYRAVAKLLE